MKKLNKSLIATATAAALVGALGVAYAQSSVPTTTPAGASDQSVQSSQTPAGNTNSAMGQSGDAQQMNNANSSPTAGSSSVDSSTSFQSEQPAQADRG